MTVLDKLLEIGWSCPCGGETEVTHNTTMGHYWMACKRCGTISIQYATYLDALTAWCVLTGGPFDARVKPPKEVMRDWTDVGADDSTWFFRPKYRTGSVIRPWLESKWEDTDG